MGAIAVCHFERNARSQWQDEMEAGRVGKTKGSFPFMKSMNYFTEFAAWSQ